MNYKLCKELKDSGFPLRAVSVSYTREGQKEVGGAFEHAKNEWYDKPNLEELIEACLKKDANFRLHCYSHGFVIEASSQIDDMEICKTPKIAVAKLYIAINK